MNTFAHRLLHSLCETLAPQEREVFLGDVEELQINSRAAITSVAGLILRRQAHAWKHWRPWAVLLGLIIPTTLLLNHAASVMADVDSLLIWMYAGNWTPAFLSRGWIVYAFIPEAAGVLYFWVAMTCWSWTVGLVIAAVSRVARWVNASLIALVLFLATANKFLTGGVSITATFLAHRGTPWSPHWFYDIVFPVFLLVLLVLLPAIFGMRINHPLEKFSPSMRKLLYLSIGLTAFSALGAPVVAWLFRTVATGLAPWRIVGATPLAFAAPVAYWVARRKLQGAHREAHPGEAIGN